MYLKRLEVFGFKTFAERTELEFAPGITAIVGPNGAGKSNLSDAILWVFGEQSMKALRSSRSHDVIFSGSRDKKAVSLAEVSLTLDNTDGILRLDYPEVTVTRRVYRSGEGEYLLNRIPCRLRDIHDLFLDTGIGRQAYSIITQSQIDAILSVRPEDRRELIEEAAGVGKYRQRKKETQRKLDATRANLLRVNDIIGELESQLEPLAQQSEQAREYKRISQELSDLRLSLLISDFDSFTSSYDKAKERESELETEIESCRTRDSQITAQEVELRAQLTRIEGNQDELRTLTAKLIHELDRQEAQEALTHEKLRANERQRESMQSDIGQLEESRVRAKQQETETETRRQELSNQQQSDLSTMKEQEEDLAKVVQEITSRESNLATLRIEQLDLLGKISERKNFQAQGASLLRAAESRMTRLGEEITEANRQVEARTATESQRKCELEELSNKLPLLEQQIEALASKREAAREHLINTEEAEDKLTQTAMSARSRLEALEELVRSREGLSPAARALMEQGFGLVSDLLQIPRDNREGLSLAVEAVLGHWLEALVCSTESDAMRGRQWLQDNEGQADFIVLNTISAASPAHSVIDNLIGKPKVLGRALDLVKFDSQYASLFNHLLGNVLIAENLDVALDISRQLPFGDWQIATLEGEVVSAIGMSLGHVRESKGPLSRQSEIETLKERLGGLDNEVLQAKEAVEQARKDLESIEEETSASRTELAASRSKLTSLQDALSLLRIELQKERQRLEDLQLEKQDLQTETEQSREEQASLDEELRTLDAQHAEFEEKLLAAESNLNQSREQRDTLAHGLETMKVAQASLIGERQTQEARLQSLRDLQQTSSQQIATRKEGIQRLEEEQKELQESLLSLQTKLVEIRSAAEKAQADLEAVGNERQQMLESIATQMEEAKANHDRRESQQASLHRLQLRLTQLEGEIGFVQRHLEEDYRISLEKAREKAQPIESRKAAQEQASALQSDLEALGTVNLGAMDEYERVKSRLEFLGGQREDLEKAREDLEKVIAEIDETAREKFLECFEIVKREFDTLFKRLFDGGETELRLTNEEEILEAGIDVDVTIPGKHRQNLLLLSGGERALTAMALIFALLKTKPTPFVVLDEVDAPLDDSNVGRYTEVLRDFAKESQFIIITHNKGSMEAADTLYGVTMQKAGISTLLSMKLTELPAA